MPELPEVETIRRGLQPFLIGRRIVDVEVRNLGSWSGNDPSLSMNRLITDITRQGKLLLFALEGGMSITIHLKMTGQLIWQAESEAVMGGHPTKAYLEELPHKHTHVIFTLDDGSRVYFNDLRKFGRVSLIESSKIAETSFIKTLGPEPLSEFFTENYLTKRLHQRPKQPVKVFLLDQTNIAGLGNIYADEALFESGILPTRLAGSLNGKEVLRLYRAIPTVLHKAIAHGGSSRKDYVNAVGEKGTFLWVAKVYQRAGQPCKVCGIPIEKVKLGGRSTHFCKNCQK